MDDIFYKVIKNKYLFNLIFFHIGQHQIKFNNSDFKPQQYNYKNKIKFKDIISLKWMVDKKEFSLLKCKLENKEKIMVDCNLKWLKKFNDLNIQLEFLSLFFNHMGLLIYINHEEIEFKDYINDNIVNLNKKLVSTLISKKSYSIEVTKSMVLRSFEKSSREVINLLLNRFIFGNKNKEIEDFKKNSIKYVFDHSGIKQFQKDIVIEIILSKKIFYSSCEVYPDIDQVLFDLVSIPVINKLIDNKFYKIPLSLIEYEKEINTIINKFRKTRRLKILIGFINLKIKIRDVNITTQCQCFKITPSIKSVKNLICFLENNRYDWKKIRNCMTFKISELFNMEWYYSISNYFFKYYLSLESIKDFSYFKFEVLDNYLISKIKFSFFKERESLLKILSEIEVIAPNNRVTSKYYNILNRIVIIDGYYIVQDIDTIEQILKIEFPSNSFQVPNYDIMMNYFDKRNGEKKKFYSINYDDWLKKTSDNKNNKEIFNDPIGFEYFLIKTSEKNINDTIKILNFILKNEKKKRFDFFMESLKTYNLNIIKLLININFHSILYDKEILNFELEELLGISKLKIVFYFCEFQAFDVCFSTLKKPENTINNIISIIELLINDFKKKVNKDKNQLLILEIIINWLYKTLIKISNISFEKVANVYFFIQETDIIKLEHSIYHSLYYLSIKSNKLIKYLMELPFINNIGVLSKGKYDLIYNEQNDSIQDFKFLEEKNVIKKYFKEEKFTFNFIFGKIERDSNGVHYSTSSFDTIISQLFKDLSYNTIITEYNKFLSCSRINQCNYSYCSYNLTFCLNILNGDLFLKEYQSYKKYEYEMDQDLYNKLKNSIFQYNVDIYSNIPKKYLDT